MREREKIRQRMRDPGNRGIYRPETSRSFGKVNPRKLHRISSHSPASLGPAVLLLRLQGGHRDKENKDKEMDRDSAGRTSCANTAARACFTKWTPTFIVVA